MPLRQSWRRSDVEEGFRPGRAGATWHDAALNFTLLFLGRPAGNRATRLNERTWELGDIGELFLQIPGRADYWEFHVTPENQRLQLHWPEGGLDSFRAGRARLGEFTLGPEFAVTSTTAVLPDRWRVGLTIPATVLGLSRYSPGQSFRAAACRYDCFPRAKPIVSSTALLQEESFHRPGEWSIITLDPS